MRIAEKKRSELSERASQMAEKPKLAIYWASSCGGCEIAVANLHERLLDVVSFFDFVFCPCLLDTKRQDVEAMPDGSIAVTLFNGAIRTEDNAEMAHLMRRKSQILIAYGACAHGGGIPALSNLHSRSDHMETIYRSGPTLDNPDGILPRERVQVPEGDLTLPRFFDEVMSLSQVVPVDYYIPGCPPTTEQVWNVLQVVMQGQALPAPGAALGAGTSSVCDECSRKRTEKKVSHFNRIWEIVPDADRCLLEQGIACMGVATRSGCGGQCPEVNMPCIGCYGAPEGVYSQAGKMISTLGSILDIDPIRDLRGTEELNARVDEAERGIPDIAGLTGKFNLATALRQHSTERRAEEK
jgi:F420-non-reducing hydrogenase small subunit